MKKEQKLAILDRLEETYPDAKAELRFSNPYEMLVATMLSAQCTDKQVNKVTPAVFSRWPDADAMACAQQAADEIFLFVIQKQAVNQPARSRNNRVAGEKRSGRKQQGADYIRGGSNQGSPHRSCQDAAYRDRNKPETDLQIIAYVDGGDPGQYHLHRAQDSEHAEFLRGHFCHEKSLLSIHRNSACDSQRLLL